VLREVEEREVLDAELLALDEAASVSAGADEDEADKQLASPSVTVRAADQPAFPSSSSIWNWTGVPAGTLATHSKELPDKPWTSAMESPQGSDGLTTNML
jgi:hypothetical protein